MVQKHFDKPPSFDGDLSRKVERDVFEGTRKRGPYEEHYGRAAGCRVFLV